MRLAVLCSPGSWYLEDLRRAAGERYEVFGAEFGQLASSFESRLRARAGTYDLTGASGMIVRTMPPGSLEQVVFRMDVLAQLASAGVVVLNSPRAVECAVDKYLTTARLVAAGLRVPRTAACQGAEEAMEAFRRLGGDVVVKPLFGGEGRGITRVADPDLAWRAFHMLQLHRAVIYLQEFIPHHGFDIRLFLVGERLLAMRRINPLDWRTNVSRGARTEAFPVDDELVVTARQAAASVGATLAGVDVLPGLDGQRYVIEVNAVPGWKALARTLDIDVAQLVLQHLTALIDDGNVQL